MKINIENMDRITGYVQKTGTIYINTTQYRLMWACKACGEPYLGKKRGRKISDFCCLKCSQGGVFHPMYGKSHPASACRKMSQTRKRSGMYAGIKNPMYGKRGEDAPNWKGGKGTSPSKRRTKVLEYKVWRQAVFYRDNYVCQLCSKRGGDKEAHHINPVRSNPELLYEIWNGVTLCKACHHSLKGKEHDYIELFLLKAQEAKQNGQVGKADF